MWCSYLPTIVVPPLFYLSRAREKLARPTISDEMKMITLTFAPYMNMSNHFGSRTYMEYTNDK